MKGEWFLDPFAWQLLMAAGILAGLKLPEVPIASHPALVGLAASVVALCAFCATDGASFWPGLNDWVRAWADVDKTMLGVGRLVHFGALAYLVFCLGLAPVLQGSVLHRMMCLLGRHGLWAFGCLSVLAAVGQVLSRSLDHSSGLDLVIAGGGLASLFGLTLLLERSVSRPSQAADVRAS